MITKKRWIATACLFYFLQIVNPISSIIIISCAMIDCLCFIWNFYRKALRLDKLQDYLKEQRDELTRKGKW